MNMVNVILTPAWFFNYNAVFELLFAIVTLAVFVFAIRVYKLSKQKQLRTFSIGFLLISISYFIQSFLNFGIISEFNEHGPIINEINHINALSFLAAYTQIIFFTLGLITLVYMTLNLKCRKTYFLLAIITISSLLISSNKVYLFYLFSSVFLAYISWHYLRNYINNKQAKTLLVLVAFVFLLFGTIHYIFSVNHTFFYIMGHILELIAYILILINLILVIKR